MMRLTFAAACALGFLALPQSASAQGNVRFPEQMRGYWRLNVDRCTRPAQGFEADAMLVTAREMRGPEVDRKPLSIRQASREPLSWDARVSESVGGTRNLRFVISERGGAMRLIVIYGRDNSEIFTLCQ